jgi:hypothetical protein
MRIRRAIISPSTRSQFSCGRPGADRGWARRCAMSATRPQPALPGEGHKQAIVHVVPML